MISSLKTALPRFHENLRYVVLPFVVEVADGVLANFVIPNNSGWIIAKFTDASPRSTSGPLQVVDGAATKVLDLPGAGIQIERGTDDPSWPGVTLGTLTLTGIDSTGRVWVGRTSGVDPIDPTSLVFEMAVSSEATASKQLNELAKWLAG